MQRLPCEIATQTRRLLRVLFFRVGALPTNTGWKHRVLFARAPDRTDGQAARRHVTRVPQSSMARANLTDVAGGLGAILAALCCAGTPLIIAALAATGLTAMRKDAILWPIMLVSLAVAILGYWQGYRMHRTRAPMIVGTVGAFSLALGVIVVHGFPAMQMIYGGAMLLVAATVWNIVARRRCRIDASALRSSPREP